jgi:N-acetylglucosaminyldiphosphoundecaprenol N-acetyl-beta-D-mannosaminyltransferase
MTIEQVEKPVWVWGLPLAPYTLVETIDAIDELVQRGRPSFFITANLHYAMLTQEDPELQELNVRAAFLVADGAPLVWASRRGSVSLPQRVAGSDLIFSLCEMAAKKGHRLFFAGGAPGVAETAVDRLSARYPGLNVSGTAAPRFLELSEPEYRRLKVQIAEARPDILIIAATMPMGEKWLSTHVVDLGVPVVANLGASLDFAAGRFSRAPGWMQSTGLEWLFRLILEPRRLFPRYARNAWFLVRMALQERWRASAPPQTPRSAPPETLSTFKRGAR